ncbi:hypothetical protein Desaci_3642 [Desulfosporosinus acidiphilus SJ4]|uniref:Uncharacterized protein n=1 Tax=Desulfosporosinus acidiphilus (strain DSM 22704 / JCM 16185 / SJ4) TaxID=646529 RepID=I4D9P9_DESAJ|nr:hypothetical protein Desaci_3642 [Desulfosporosinus acidiphilus SJ4]
MTQRSVIRTVQALVFGVRGSRHKRRPTAMDGLVSPKPRMAGGDHGAMAAVHIPVHRPGLESLSRSLLSCLRKDFALVSYCVLSLGRGTTKFYG